MFEFFIEHIPDKSWSVLYFFLLECPNWSKDWYFLNSHYIVLRWRTILHNFYIIFFFRYPSFLFNSVLLFVCFTRPVVRPFQHMSIEMAEEAAEASPRPSSPMLMDADRWLLRRGGVREGQCLFMDPLVAYYATLEAYRCLWALHKIQGTCFHTNTHFVRQCMPGGFTPISLDFSIPWFDLHAGYIHKTDQKKTQKEKIMLHKNHWSKKYGVPLSGRGGREMRGGVGSGIRGTVIRMLCVGNGRCVAV